MERGAYELTGLQANMEERVKPRSRILKNDTKELKYGWSISCQYHVRDVLVDFRFPLGKIDNFLSDNIYGMTNL